MSEKNELGVISSALLSFELECHKNLTPTYRETREKKRKTNRGVWRNTQRVQLPRACCFWGDACNVLWLLGDSLWKARKWLDLLYNTSRFPPSPEHAGKKGLQRVFKSAFVATQLNSLKHNSDILGPVSQCKRFKCCSFFASVSF